MQKKTNKKRIGRTIFSLIATVTLSGTALPIWADATLEPLSEEIQVYKLSSSDADPLATLKTQILERKVEKDSSINAEASTLNVAGFDETKLGLQHVTLNMNLENGDSLVTTQVEKAAVTVAVDDAPIIELSTDAITLTAGDEFDSNAYISRIYESNGVLPTLRVQTNLDNNTDGTYDVHYEVIALNGKTASASLSVTVVTPEPEPEPVVTTASVSVPQEAVSVATPSYSSSGSNPYYGGWGNCTFGCWELVLQNRGIALPNFGSASEWVGRAASLGYATGYTPVAGSIAVYYGHVAYVAQVSADGSSVYIQEGGMNGGYYERWVSSAGTGTKALIGYIYL